MLNRLRKKQRTVFALLLTRVREPIAWDSSLLGAKRVDSTLFAERVQELFAVSRKPFTTLNLSSGPDFFLTNWSDSLGHPPHRNTEEIGPANRCEHKSAKKTASQPGRQSQSACKLAHLRVHPR